ncbi:MAG: multidrug transporter ATP-binding protein, partial [Variovorax sp.]|nr:multidrug transporter ATP-binding protein [Variovorax sp.]
DARALMTGRITDAYTNIATVKLFSHTQREAGFARDAMREFMHTGYGQMRLVSLFEITNHALSMALTAGMCGTALWLWSNGAVGIGAVAASTAMALRLQGMSHWIMWEMTSLFENIGTVQDGMKTLSRPRTVLDVAAAAELAVPRGEVRFDHASFRYSDGGRRVIDDMTLVVAPGEKIGLVGRSGAGKSTLVNLLLRFHDLESGRILIDGQDIAQVTQDSLRRHIGMVTQDTSLLHRSVSDNIDYGRPDAGDVAVRSAAERAEAHEFIQTLGDAKGRQGYDAHVGERGVKLSGGQRQRVAIARVMLKDAPILLLDEATSALDSEVEAAIQQSLYTLMEGKTVIAIAHRLSTMRQWIVSSCSMKAAWSKRAITRHCCRRTVCMHACGRTRVVAFSAMASTISLGLDLLRCPSTSTTAVSFASPTERADHRRQSAAGFAANIDSSSTKRGACREFHHLYRRPGRRRGCSAFVLRSALKAH